MYGETNLYILCVWLIVGRDDLVAMCEQLSSTDAGFPRYEFTEFSLDRFRGDDLLYAIRLCDVVCGECPSEERTKYDAQKFTRRVRCRLGLLFPRYVLVFILSSRRVGLNNRSSTIGTFILFSFHSALLSFV